MSRRASEKKAAEDGLVGYQRKERQFVLEWFDGAVQRNTRRGKLEVVDSTSGEERGLHYFQR